jgi:hypothetical protein
MHIVTIALRLAALLSVSVEMPSATDTLIGL